MVAPQPGIGDWYRQKEGGALFEVVAYDDDDGTIEIQYFDGTVDEWPFSHWQDLDIERTGAPPDASGALEDGADDGRDEG